jgi:hypothetical protein
MHESQLHAWDRGRETARTDDHRARHRAEAIDLLAARRRARLRALLAHLRRPGARAPESRRPLPDPCHETPKAAA